MFEALSKLMVVLGADTAAYQRDIGKAAEVSKEHFSSIGDAAKMAAASLAGLFALDHIKEGIEHAADYADELAHMARQTGQSVESLSRMTYALKLNDTAVEDYQDGIRKLSKNMVSAQQGGEAATSMFAALGIQVTDASGNLRDSGDVFLDVADRISKMQDGAQKTTLEMQLFGKSAGPKLQEMLNTGRDGISQLTDEAQKMGAVVSGPAAYAAADLHDQIEKMHIAQQALYMEMAQDLLPVMKDFSEKGTNAAINSGVLEKSAHGLTEAFKVLYTGASVLGQVLGVLGDTYGRMAAIAVSVGTGDFAAAKAIWNDKTATDQYRASVLALGDVWNDTGKAAVTAADDQQKAHLKLMGLADDEDEEGGKAGRAKKKKERADGSAVDQLRQQLGSPEEREQADYERQRQMLERANDSAFHSAQERHQLLEKLEADHVQKMAEIRQTMLEKDAQIQQALTDIGYESQQTNAAIQEEKAMGDLVDEYYAQKTIDAEKAKQAAFTDTKNFVVSGLGQLSRAHSSAAQAAQAISKAQALSQIASQTPVMAAQAASAVAGIPVIGPALALAASTSMYALGALMAADVVSGGKSGAGGGGVSVGNASAVTPVSQQQPQQPTTILNIPENALLTGRMLVDLLNEALGDGKQLSNLRVMGA